MIGPHSLNVKVYVNHAEHAEAWNNIIRPRSDAVLAELEAARDQKELIIVRTSPVQSIREVLDNGEDVYLGDISFIRLADGKLLGTPGVEVTTEDAPRYAAENAERAVGDPDIIWSVGGKPFQLYPIFQF